MAADLPTSLLRPPSLQDICAGGIACTSAGKAAPSSHLMPPSGQGGNMPAKMPRRYSQAWGHSRTPTGPRASFQQQLGVYYGRNVCVPSCTEVLTPKATGLGVLGTWDFGDLGRLLGSGEVMRVGPHNRIGVLIRGRETRGVSVCHVRDAAKRWPSASQEEALTK